MHSGGSYRIINNLIISYVVYSDWNKDYKPAPFPKTEQEIAAAAKKYNLLPEEYKPYADDGLGYGDYPHLPDVSIETRDAYYPYDFPEHKRNFKEPVSEAALICISNAHLTYNMLLFRHSFTPTSI